MELTTHLRVGFRKGLVTGWIGCVSLLSTEATNVNRIVTLDSGTDTLVLQLADLDHVIAVRERTQDPSVSLQWEKAREVRGLKVEMAEAVYSLHPDLVFLSPWSGRSTRKLLNQLGVRVECLKSPKTWDDVYSNIRRVGELVGAPDRAERMIVDMQERLADIHRRIQNYPRKRAVFYVGRGSTFGSNTRQNMVIESAGLVNLTAEKGIKGIGKLSVEQLLLSNPDVIIFSNFKKNVPTLARQILEHPAFDKLADDQVVMMDLPSNRINCHDHYLVDCVEILARSVYPEAFDDTDCIAATISESKKSSELSMNAQEAFVETAF